MKSKKLKSVLCLSLLAFLCLGTSGCNNEEPIDPDPGIPPVDEPDDEDGGDTKTDETEPGEVIPDDNPDDDGDGDGGDEPDPEPTYNYDSAYALVGDFADSAWDLAPAEDSIYYLAYDSTQSSSMYWERTVTINPTTQEWEAGFRVCKYNETTVDGSWVTTVGYSNLADGSTGVIGTDGEDNIKVNWGGTYNLTIDCTGSTPSILVVLQSENPDEGGDGGGSGNDGDVTVNKIDNIANNDDYILGADLSSIIEVEEAGGIFYDFDGNPVDCIAYLAESGINYVRIRLWNSPYVTAGDSTSGSFQGGGNDLETDLKIAKRAYDAGMKICLDFHYSDFWADPEKQVCPREWAGVADLSSTAASWTSEVLKAFTENGCPVSMVQVGNEINGNRVCGLTSSNVYPFLAACCNAVRTYNSNIKIVMHLADSTSYSNLAAYFQGFINNGVDYDVIGLSYYSYYHGSISNFESTIKSFDSNFDKDICVMEYSYGWTTQSGGKGRTSNNFGTSEESAGGYTASPQGQASYIHDVNEVVANASHGIGSFYWEPAWLSLPNTSWASTNALDWYVTYADPTATSSWFGTCTWANQALFDYDGYALGSLKAYDMMRNGEESNEHYVSGDLDFSGRIDASSDRTSQLPSTTQIYTTLERYVNCDITWNSEDLATLESAAVGSTVTLHGTITFNGETLNVTGTYTLYKEYITNGSFEDGAATGTATGWTLTGTGGKYRSDGNARTGNYYYNPWLATDYSCGVYQTIANLDAGTYTLGVYWRTDSGSDMTNTLYATLDGGDPIEVVLPSGTSYTEWVYSTLTFTATTGQSVEVGLKTTGVNSAWAHVDDFTLYI